MYLLGYDIGSSSVKAALVRAADGATVGTAHYPDTEMAILAPQPDWAEQDPATWWEAVKQVTQRLLATTGVAADQIVGIGLGYQMHGLVLLDAQGEVLRPAIIWCDSRAVPSGDAAFAALGADYCRTHLLQSPGNFTASKLHWVRQNEPDIFEKIHQFLLPGDYIAYRMTGEMCTTVTGLSEGICWDFKENRPAQSLLDYYGIPASMLPRVVPVFAQQGKMTAEAAAYLGLAAGIPISYRAGDQPNNALSLNVLRPGDVAATGGTSGVVYAVTDQPRPDPELRVNSFAHVNYTPERPLTGVLLCINGAGSQYRWLRQMLGDLTYPQMEQLAATAPIGADGLQILPFGNGAERMLGNRPVGAQVLHLNFNRHNRAHLCRAALEGIAFAFVYGMAAMREIGIPLKVLRVGNDNLFQSAIFSTTIATLMGVDIEMLNTNGAAGAAKGAGVGVGIFDSVEAAMGKVEVVGRYAPLVEKEAYEEAYGKWKGELETTLKKT